MTVQDIPPNTTTEGGSPTHDEPHAGDWALYGASLESMIAWKARAVAAESQLEHSQWRPIEDAPRDNRSYLFVTQGGIQRVDGFAVSQMIGSKHRHREYPSDPYTHWMHLPAAPETGA